MNFSTIPCCCCKCEANQDILLVCDTTGSMTTELAFLQSAFNTIVGEIGETASCKWGLCQYKDDESCGDYRVEEANGVNVVHTLTTTYSDIQTGLAGLSATGGGNTPEEWMKSLKSICDNWVSLVGGDSATEVVDEVTRFVRQRIIIVMGDAVGHEGVVCSAEGIYCESGDCTGPGGDTEFFCDDTKCKILYPTLSQVMDASDDPCIQMYFLDFGLDSTGQGTSLADHTSGKVYSGLATEQDVKDAICDALSQPRRVCGGG